MVTSAAKYDLADNFFVQEILQLGLPKENADAIATLYRRSKDDLRQHFSDSMHLHHHRLASADWRVDRILASGGYCSQHGSKEETGGGGGDAQPQPQLLPPPPRRRLLLPMRAGNVSPSNSTTQNWIS